jgi:hypothetical protein
MPPRSERSDLLTEAWNRVVEYRHIMIRAANELRPDSCEHCHAAARILREADHPHSRDT